MEVLTSVLFLIAGLGVLMIGMKMLSEGLERSAGKGMRKLFGKISDNRFAGVGVGAVATVLVNSSAATTVMVIGFVNAGLMTLVQATAIIMGANIGTTVTGQILAFKVKNLAYLFIIAGVPLSFFCSISRVSSPSLVRPMFRSPSVARMTRLLPLGMK